MSIGAALLDNPFTQVGCSKRMQKGDCSKSEDLFLLRLGCKKLLCHLEPSHASTYMVYSFAVDVHCCRNVAKVDEEGAEGKTVLFAAAERGQQDGQKLLFA